MAEFETVPHVAYNWMIVMYFFFGGLSAGAYLLSVAANYWLTEFKAFARNAAVVVPIGLALGLFLLWIDLGIPMRVIGLLVSFNPSAPISWGTWFLGIFFAISAVYALACVKGKEAKARPLALLGIPFALLVATYTGVLLSRAPGKILWHSALVPVVFLNGGLISGTALALLLAPKQADNTLMTRLGRILACLIVLEVVMIGAEIAVLAGGGTVSVAAARALLTGEFSGLFWGVEIIAGAGIPLLILLTNRKSRGLQAVASILLLVGIYTMRHIIIIGGQVIGQH